MERKTPDEIMRGLGNDHDRLICLTNEVANMKEDVEELRESKVWDNEFEPIKRIVYGLVTIILLGVVGALLKIIIN